MTVLVCNCFCLESAFLICSFWFLATRCNLYLSRVHKIPGVISMETTELNVKCYVCCLKFPFFFFFFPQRKAKTVFKLSAGENRLIDKHGKSSSLLLQRRDSSYDNISHETACSPWGHQVFGAGGPAGLSPRKHQLHHGAVCSHTSCPQSCSCLHPHIGPNAASAASAGSSTSWHQGTSHEQSWQGCWITSRGAAL